MLNTIILAAPTSSAVDGGSFFTSTDLGKAIASLMKAVALLVVLVAAVKAVKDVLAGKGGKAVQLIIGAAVVVAFLWDPTLITKILDLFSGLTGKSVDSVDQVTNTGR